MGIMNKVIKLTLASLAFVFIAASPAIVLADYNSNNSYYPYYPSSTNNSSTVTKYATVGQYFEFNIYAQDYNNGYGNNNLNYQATYLPAGARFDVNSRVFSWTPQRAGQFSARFHVSDGYDYADLDVTINVKSAFPVIGVGGNSSGNQVQNKELPKIVIINTKLPQETKTVYVYKERKEETVVDEEKSDVEEVKEEIKAENDLTLAATIVGIIDNIILNPLFLLILIIVLLVSLYFYRKRNRDLEQELNMNKGNQQDN
jgi:hypothetical protein